jgi:hypothetical protein
MMPERGLFPAFCALVGASVLGCARAPSPAPAATSEKHPSTLQAIDLAKAAGYLTELASLCTADGGKLWGKSLCGPVLIVDPETREVVANQADPGGLLTPTGHPGVFAGRWPATETIANTAIAWKGTRWTMIMYGALEGESRERGALLMHEAFHRVQPDLALEAEGKANGTNRQLDERDGRFWLQLEWNALEASLAEGASPRERSRAIEDALTFRAARRARFADTAVKETELEINEGLAEYTGERLAGWSTADVLKEAARRRSRDTGFVRSFAYVSGPLYGYALDATGADWRKHVTAKTDLGALLGELANAKASPSIGDARRRGDLRGGKALASAEDARASKRAAQIADWRRSLVDGPVLTIDLNTVTAGGFDPRTVYPISETETVFTGRTLIGSWGTLDVDGGAILIDDAASRATVSVRDGSPDSLHGKGWSLTLAPGWAVEPGKRKGDATLVHRPGP